MIVIVKEFGNTPTFAVECKKFHTKLHEGILRLIWTDYRDKTDWKDFYRGAKIEVKGSR